MHTNMHQHECMNLKIKCNLVDSPTQKILQTTCSALKLVHDTRKFNTFVESLIFSKFVGKI